jgi:7,8-dihydropterin-6-yl-methyl-4-(beta-D-ribofuranosyl)aminobenzene 5'-phosphate synthase
VSSEGADVSSAANTIQVTVLVENEAAPASPATGEHGLALLVEAQGRTVLLDTGASDAVVRNADALGLGDTLRRLDAIVITHGHYDHAGGLASALARAGRPVPVHVGPGFFARRLRVGDAGSRDIGVPLTRDALEQRGARVVEETGPREILPGFLITGEITPREEVAPCDPGLCRLLPTGTVEPDAFPDELVLAVGCAGGIAVLVGCAHRGLVNSVLAAREAAGSPHVVAVIGGAHLCSATRERVSCTLEALKGLGLGRVALGHCTGASAEGAAAAEFGRGFTRVRTASMLCF